MAYLIERNHRFYVVAYDGIDPVARAAEGISPAAAKSMPR